VDFIDSILFAQFLRISYKKAINQNDIRAQSKTWKFGQSRKQRYCYEKTAAFLFNNAGKVDFF
jgi:hypothetical protein